MKTITYLLIAIFIFGIIGAGFINKSNATHNILIQSTDSNISSVLLSQSAEIISKRLKSFSAEKFDITTFPDKNQIQVTLTNNWDLKAAENLIMHKGALEFYEAYSYKDLTELLKGDTLFLSLFSEKTPGDLYATIGCASSTEVNKIDEFINSAGLNQKCKFAWGNLNRNSKTCLYALKLNNGNGVLLRGADIESFKFKHDTIWKKDYIEFQFKKSAIEIWSAITKRNINRSIAMVLDNIVLAAPMVRSEINNGSGQITGDFTQTEVRYIAAIGDNGELPVSFKVLK